MSDARDVRGCVDIWVSFDVWVQGFLDASCVDVCMCGCVVDVWRVDLWMCNV